VPHVFVETNWLFDYAAPAHNQVPEAVELLERSKRGEFTLHLPNLCIGEARQAIRTKCQPRREAEAIRRFLTDHAAAGITAVEAESTRTILDKYERSIKDDLDQLDDRLNELAMLDHLHIFGLDDEMLARSTALILGGITLKPFDQSILAAVLVSSERLWHAGERGLSFCDTDTDLLPWAKDGTDKPNLRASYNNAHVWVYSDFTLTRPTRRQNFE